LPLKEVLRGKHAVEGCLINRARDQGESAIVLLSVLCHVHLQGSDDCADRCMRLDCVPQWGIGIEFVVVATSSAFVLEIVLLFELGNDPLSCSFCDPDTHCNLAKCRVRVFRDTEEDMRVVGKERPFGVHRRTSVGIVVAAIICVPSFV